MDRLESGDANGMWLYTGGRRVTRGIQGWELAGGLMMVNHVHASAPTRPVIWNEAQPMPAEIAAGASGTAGSRSAKAAEGLQGHESN